MSRGISWRQHTMLDSIARKTQQTEGAWVDGKWVRKPVLRPVAWRAINYGPTDAEGSPDYGSRRVEWNYEQSVRRALRSLERREMVTLAQYVFRYETVHTRFGESMTWTYIDPSEHNPSRGDTRGMTGAMLTEIGWAVAHTWRRQKKLPPLDA